MLRDQNLISLIVMERSRGGPSDLLGNEGFLVDGIIELGLTVRREAGKVHQSRKDEGMQA